MSKTPKNGPVVGYCPGFKCKRKVRAAFVNAEGKHTAQISAGFVTRGGGNWHAAYRGPCGTKVLKIGTEAFECEGGCGYFAVPKEVADSLGLRGRDAPIDFDAAKVRGLGTQTGWKCWLCRTPEERGEKEMVA
jgi:hypothetical protein